MKKFSKGDRIRVKNRDHEGVVIKTLFNSITQEDEIYVVWDHFHYIGDVRYIADQVKDLWEVVSEVKDSNSAVDILVNVNFDINQTTEKQCDHKWVDIGFQQSKVICYHCNVDKK